MMKKRKVLILSLGVLAWGLTGCGAAGKEVTQAAPDSTVNTTAAIAAQAKEEAESVLAPDVPVPPGDYPGKDITVIVASGAGGGTDITARAFLQVAEKYTPVKFLVSNISGGGGWTAWRECLAGDSDGYTLAVTLIGMFADSGSGDTWEDFTPLCNMTAYPRSFVTTPDSDIQTVEDLVAMMKENPGSVRLAIDGLGATDHLAAQKFEEMAGVKFAYVPFTGFAEDAAALLGGNVELTCGGVPDYATRTDLKPLAIWGPKRIEQWPDVPTMQELGYDLSVMSFRGLGVKNDVPQEIKDYLSQVFEKAANDPEWIKVAKETNLYPYYLNSADSAELMKSTYETVFVNVKK
ncbi:MAG: tripartite tricarboxylate transporter substrate binding protein [Clostridium sp.]|nr:tripartite tricarboxylate transporter substrate binding protein [Clostridium sp.]